MSKDQARQEEELRRSEIPGLFGGPTHPLNIFFYFEPVPLYQQCLFLSVGQCFQTLSG